MKPRNREISIFNLSMMDVISGAMGAFLILVVILSRHYQAGPVTTNAIIELQRELIEATGQLDEASRRIHAGTGDNAAIEGFLRQAKQNVEAGRARITGLQNEVAVANARIQRLEEQSRELQQRITDLQWELDLRNPYFVKAHWECEQRADVDIYLYSAWPSKSGGQMAPYRPGTEQGAFFTGDVYSDAEGTAGAEVWLNASRIASARQKLYFGLGGEARPKCSVIAYVYSSLDQRIDLPMITLDQQTPWVLVGTLLLDENRALSFKPASAAERAAEQREVIERARSK